MNRLPTSRYVSLTTFRRTGEPVATPVWAAPDGDALVVWTRADSGKVKRLRHTSRVTVAPCDMRGRLEGPAVDAVAEFLDRAEWSRARGALARRYGWQWRITYGTSRIAARVTHRGRERQTMIRITPAA
ncbi:PPOX class F420-dependent oxidoreductase [Modestobacter sp. VKM Ac-2984]|uniref:PPOX class F420-dependent oxidoreductase n=1 Tax=Modestobacter sp. VKM Ac-2984 TaxID=3004138 RepID=UPI0022AB0786|nr:PPOX class F420-dependent oxidoreductase [Modestobacter sp. VKM Ac-2984]MCZ2814811.1 PPOX class F420-dependent oxidoreductase [Modestobacter sp. VKM Ac-2984]